MSSMHRFPRPNTSSRLRLASLGALVVAGLSLPAPAFADSTKEELEETEHQAPASTPPQAPADSLATPDENPSVPSVATPDGAEDRSGEAIAPSGGTARSFRAFGNRVGLEVDAGFVSSSKSLTSVGMTAVAQIELFRNLLIDAELPMSFAAGDAVADASTFALGNIGLGSHWALNFDDQFALKLGGTISIPTMLLNPGADDLGRVVASGGAAAARGFADFHRFAYGNVGVRFGGDLEAYLTPNVILRTSLYPAIYAPVRETGTGFVASFNDDGAQFFVDQVNELEYRLDAGLGFGLRFQEVFTLTKTDKIQTAVEPFVGYEPSGAGITARLGAFMPLDNDLGPFWEEGRVFAARAAVGGKW